MKRTVTGAIAGLLLTGAVGSATAQSYAWQPYPSHSQPAAFDNHYLDQHPEVARQLSADPRLIDDPRYVANHPGLRDYLANHPSLRSEFREHPDRFMADERRFERPEDHSHRQAYPLTASANYLEQHPDVAQQLNRRPWLVDDPGYVAAHSGLREFLQTHPIARSGWQSHPYQYLHRDDRYERNH
jgi:hypothetical protein